MQDNSFCQTQHFGFQPLRGLIISLLSRLPREGLSQQVTRTYKSSKNSEWTRRTICGHPPPLMRKASRLTANIKSKQKKSLSLWKNGLFEASAGWLKSRLLKNRLCGERSTNCAQVSASKTLFDQRKSQRNAKRQKAEKRVWICKFNKFYIFFLKVRAAMPYNGMRCRVERSCEMHSVSGRLIAEKSEFKYERVFLSPWNAQSSLAKLLKFRIAEG